MRVMAGETSIADVDDALDRLRGIGEAHGVVVQGVDARYVAGRAHLARAVRCAHRARANDDGIAADPAVEVLCYAAGRRQIDDALRMGLPGGDGPAAMLAVDLDRDAPAGDPTAVEEAAGAAIGDAFDIDPAGTQPADRVLAPTDREALESFFTVTAAEQAATDASLAALVRERCALLSVTK